MNDAIADFVAEQQGMNNVMDIPALNRTLSKARMGMVCLKECIDKTSAIAAEMSGGSSEYLLEI